MDMGECKNLQGCLKYVWNKNISVRNFRKKWTREDNKNVIHCYFKTTYKQKVYRKRMIKIWAEPVEAKTKMILHEGSLSDLEILEICGQVSSDE